METLKSIKTNGRIVGILFLIVMITWMIGYSLIESILNSSEYLNIIHSKIAQLKVGVFFELIEASAVIGIAALMYPLFKKQNKGIALIYVSFRIIEATMLIIGAIIPLVFISLSQRYLELVSPDISYFHTLGKLLMAVREQGTSLIIAMLYGFGASIFYYLLYRLKLIPRFISVWGLIAVALMLMDQIFFEFGGYYIGTISGLPVFGLQLGLIEIFLGIWLVIKGFNSPVISMQIK